jgi:hypothetical protein
MAAAQDGVAAPQRSFAGWQPDDGARDAATRLGPRFEGLPWMTPLRLHLALGGHVDGWLGAVDAQRQEILLLLPADSFRVHWSLVDAVTPLAPPGTLSEGGAPAVPGLPDAGGVLRWRPTERSWQAGALSLLLPGLGHLAIHRESGLGAALMAGYLGSVGAALLVTLVPNSYTPATRRTLAGIFVGVAVTDLAVASAHSFRLGMERRRVPTRSGRRGAGGRVDRLPRLTEKALDE